MSRHFSTTVRRLKKLNWKLNGTTENVEWVQNLVNAVVDQVPNLAARVDSGAINGNPHPTGDDPLHASGVIGKKSLKGKNRVTSFHAYPDGRVVFSDKALAEVKIENTSDSAETSTSAEGHEDGRAEK